MSAMPRRPMLQRFEELVMPEPNSGCWLWYGFCGPSGYGRFRVANAMRQAHRFAYEAYVGPIPAGLSIDHKCRMPSCVNPAHLEPVTHIENVRRGIEATKTHCLRGHLLSGGNLARYRNKRHCITCGKMRRALSRQRALEKLS